MSDERIPINFNYYYTAPLSLPLSIVYLRNLIARVGYYFSVESNIQIVPKFKLIQIVTCTVKEDLYRHTHTHQVIRNLAKFQNQP